MMMATYNDAMNEWAYNVGADVPTKAWLLSDYDVWVRNPHYHGPDVPHPDRCPEYDNEDCDTEEYGDGMTDVEADADALRNIGWGTDEDYGYFGDE